MGSRSYPAKTAAAAVAIGAAIAGSLEGQVHYHTVALSDRPAPGMAAGVNYAGVFVPAVNDGQVVYVATAFGGGVTQSNNQLLYAGSIAAPQLTAREGDAAPGTPAGVNYAGFTLPSVNPAGQLAYVASLSGSGVTDANNAALYAGAAGAAPQLVARKGDLAPGAPVGLKYSSFPLAPLLNDAGQVAYLTTIAINPVNPNALIAIYAGNIASPQLVAYEEGPAAGMPEGVTYSDLFSVLVNDPGQVAYFATLSGTGVSAANDVAIYVGPPAAPQPAVRSGAPAPGTGGATYAFLEPAGLNDAGQIAYRTSLAGSGVMSGENDVAIYAGAPAAPQLIARAGDPAPGTPAGVNFRTVGAPALNDVGDVAYIASLTGPGTEANDVALYVDPAAGAPARLVLRRGDPAPGTPAGVTYSTLDQPAFNDAGQLAFLANVAGPDITGLNNRALFAYDPVLGEILIAREGTPFDTGAGDLRTIIPDGIGFLRGFGDDSPTGLADDGTIAFALFFSDGTSGVFTATIPEPAALGLAALTGLACARGRRRRRWR